MESQSISARLPKDFKFVLTANVDTSLLQLSGPIKTQDELDAIVTALGVMREWLAPSSDSGRLPEGEDGLPAECEASQSGPKASPETPHVGG